MEIQEYNVLRSIWLIFTQTFIIGAFWDKDECVSSGGSKVKIIVWPGAQLAEAYRAWHIELKISS